MKQKVFLLSLLVVFPFIEILAGDNEARIALSSSLLYKNGLDVSLSYEIETSYHNCWEVYVLGYLKWDKCPKCGRVCKDSFWKNYRSWQVGSLWKPCIVRKKNNYGNLRVGIFVGSDLDEVIGGGHLGYQHNFVFSHGWQIFLGTKVDLIINGEDLFRSGIFLGFKIPVK